MTFTPEFLKNFIIASDIMELSNDTVTISGQDHGTLSGLDGDHHPQYVLEATNISTTSPMTGGATLIGDLTLGIDQSTSSTDGYLTSGDWTMFNSKMNNPMTTLGDLIYGGTAGTPIRLEVGSVGTVLHGGTTPHFNSVTETEIVFSDVSLLNANSSKHGLLPTLSDSETQFLNGKGNWVTPAGQSSGYTTQTFVNEVSVNIVHNFGSYPVVQVTNDVGAVIIPYSIVNNTVNDFTVSFSSLTSGTILATIGSPQAQSVITVSSDYSINISDRIVKAITAGILIILPTASGNAGREYIIDNDSFGNITLSGYQTIEHEIVQILPDDSAIHTYSDGSSWRLF